MTIVLNATTGISTPPVTVLGDTSGSISIVAPAVAGTNTQTLLAATGTLSPFNSDTAKTAPPTVPQYFEFTGIPSWVRRVTVMFSGVSLSGTTAFLFQLGTSGGVVISGYAGGGMRVGGSTVAAASFTTGFSTNNATAAATYGGNIIFTNVSGNIWSASGVLGTSGGVESAAMTGGSVSLGGTLDRIRITTTGSDTFDAGTINVLYE